MAVVNINTPQRVGNTKAFSEAVGNVCLNSSERVIEAGVKERGYKIDGNPAEGHFRVGLKASPVETPSDITAEALAMANEVLVDTDVVAACIWGTMSIDNATQDEVHAFVNFNIN